VTVSRWDPIATYFLAGWLIVGILGMLIERSSLIFAVCNLIGFVGFVALKSLVGTSDMRPIWVCVALPLGLGISLLALPIGRPVPALLCFTIAIIAGLWFFVLKYPPPYRRALIALRSGELTEALKLASEAIDLSPDLSELYELRSGLHLALYQAVEAENDAHATIRLNPKQPFGHVALGLALVAQQKYAGAKAAFDRALELAPQIIQIHYGEGLVCYRLGDFEKALHYLRNCAGNILAPESRFLRDYYMGSSLMQLGDVPGAMAILTGIKKYRPIYEKMVDAARNAPDYPTVMIWRGELEEIKGYMG
jgi:tetratricopeptide (TPR) repeat protein